MPTPTPARPSTDARAWLAGAAALTALSILGLAVLFDARGDSGAPATPSSGRVPAADGPFVRQADARRATVQLAAPAAETRQPPGNLELETLVERHPEQALARISAQAPSDDAGAQRLKVLEVRALVALRRIGLARNQAAVYYSRWPDGPDVALLERLTGRHPTPSR